MKYLIVIFIFITGCSSKPAMEYSGKKESLTYKDESTHGEWMTDYKKMLIRAINEQPENVNCSGVPVDEESEILVCNLVIKTTGVKT
ncbi:MAG: hypothetical protein HRU20_06305 [Pseudomonadales bacterium]|nr:hypothetical protein [Pseudomonadales bacterium]